MSELLRIEYSTVRRFDHDKGFGFIICPKGGVDIYFHRDNFYTVENRNGRVMFVLARKSRTAFRVLADVEVAFIREVRSNGRVIASKWVFAREYRMIPNFLLLLKKREGVIAERRRNRQSIIAGVDHDPTMVGFFIQT